MPSSSSSPYIPLAGNSAVRGPPRNHTSTESDRSSISAILEDINEFAEKHGSFSEPSGNNNNAVFYAASPNDADSSTFLNGLTSRKAKNSRRTRVLLWVSGVMTVLLVGSIALFSSVGSTAHSSENASAYADSVIHSDKRLFDMKAWREGALAPSYKPIRWVAPAPGDDKAKLIEETSEGFVLENWPDRTNKSTIMAEAERVLSYKDKSYFVSQISLSPDQKHALLTTNRKKNYRHSSFSVFFVYNIESKKYTPLVPHNPDAACALALWAPTSDKVAFILDNNLYVRTIKDQSEDVKQVTKDGGTEIFYGVPDWVYEEEVFQGNTAMWWSPQGDYLAFLRSNNSAVEEFPIPYFVQTGSAVPYPELRKIKYPKPGSANPIVDLQIMAADSLEVFDVKVESPETNDPEKLITEVVWTGADTLVMRITNRESDVLKVGVFNAKHRLGKISRTVDVSGADGGWFEISQNTQFVPANPEQGRPEDGYIDMVVVDGYNHLAYFAPVDAPEPKAVLTSGKWEVEDQDVIFNHKTNRVYFIATKESAVERHLYSVKIDGSDLQAITNTTEDGWYRASFSADNRYVLISYAGPGIPWQKVLDLEADDMWSSAVELNNNDHLIGKLKSFSLPESRHSQVKVAVDKAGQDVLANAIEHLPPFFDPTKKYPVLFYVYGGPTSQMVNKQFSYGFSHVVASTLNAVVVTVDGRGTGFMGRDFRSCVRGQLGVLESEDQIAAAKVWAAKPYVDASRMAIWGWSYGGFMTLKTLETDAGQTFSYGMSVAPVTDWRFYDSVYTERYMKTPVHNRAGYTVSAIHNVTAISQAHRFLVMHGSGDDNVHFQNTLVLLDKMDLAQVENYDVHVFPDSDHSIGYHNANVVVYDKLLNWLSNAFAGKLDDLR